MWSRHSPCFGRRLSFERDNTRIYMGFLRPQYFDGDKPSCIITGAQTPYSTMNASDGINFYPSGNFFTSPTHHHHHLPLQITSTRSVPVITALLAACHTKYRPNREQTVDEDEVMVGFKGRLSIKQYLPMNPVKQGFKISVHADGHNVYICQFEWH